MARYVEMVEARRNQIVLIDSVGQWIGHRMGLQRTIQGRSLNACVLKIEITSRLKFK
jgi:hypothetical protein